MHKKSRVNLRIMLALVIVILRVIKISCLWSHCRVMAAAAGLLLSLIGLKITS